MIFFRLPNFYCSKCCQQVNVIVEPSVETATIWHPTKEYHGADCEDNNKEEKVLIADIAV